MRIRKRLPLIFTVLAIAAAVAVAVQVRKHAPPEPARLLPTADGYFYVNLKWIRRVDIAGQLPPVPHDPEYEQFIQATGFQFERDLDQAAFAVHYPASLTGAGAAATGAPDSPRFSEIFVGKIDGERLRAYLRKLANSVEPYGAVDIYNIRIEGRTVRVAILSVDTVAASNHPDPRAIQGIIDRSRKLAWPFGGAVLLRQYYKHIPLASLAWAIFKVDPSAASVRPSSMDLSLLFSKPAVVVTSARYLGAVHVRAEAFTESEDEARHVTEQVSALLAIFHAAEGTVSGSDQDQDVKQFFDSVKVEQHSDRAVLTTVVPPGFFRKAVAVPVAVPPVK
jgi:hypothetical protein